VGNILSEFPLDLSGYSIVILYPDTNISTAEAYRDVFPALQDYLSGNFSTSP
jgi:4-diphosphocytidyl-2C-methyl-D-erythritol kinase